MNVWIVYDSKYGNNKRVAEAIASHFTGTGAVHVHPVREISHKTVNDGKVDVLILGGPVHFGAPSLTIRRWATGVKSMMDKESTRVKFLAIWATHLKDDDEASPGKCSWQAAMEGWNAILHAFPAEGKLPGIQDFAVGAINSKDGLVPGWQDAAAHFAATIKNMCPAM